MEENLDFYKDIIKLAAKYEFDFVLPTNKNDENIKFFIIDLEKQEIRVDSTL